ncbi:MAG: glycosyltransferase [Rubrivivax sp.]|nr:glycosyltransferase [Rubrivivax sp.]
MAKLAWVAIGRNEGARLEVCLTSLNALGGGTVVYVDSGSADNSVAFARSAGADVVELDMSTPFTAARSRNAGLAQLLQRHPEARYVHFIDGDCELLPGWVDEAEKLLDLRPEVAVVAGRVIERRPHDSIYNQLCQFDWDGARQFGEVEACGGIALMRIEALQQIRGFNPQLIAGEEPELCVRLRDKGWKIWRLDIPMCLHDAAMTRFGQWWTRVERSGHAFAEGFAMHGGAPHFHGRDHVRRAWIWGGAIPLLTLLLTAWAGWPGLLLLLVYPMQALRVALRPVAGYSFRVRIMNAAFLMLARLAEFKGVLRYHWRRLLGQQPKLIEYK